jgi:hypothetical protein
VAVLARVTARDFDRAPPFCQLELLFPQLLFPPTVMEPKDTESIGGLGGLYSDLCAIEQHPNVNLERLCFELEAHLPDFQKLLDKSPKNNASRQTVLTGN